MLEVYESDSAARCIPPLGIVHTKTELLAYVRLPVLYIYTGKGH